MNLPSMIILGLFTILGLIIDLIIIVVALPIVILVAIVKRFHSTDSKEIDELNREWDEMQ